MHREHIRVMAEAAGITFEEQDRIVKSSMPLGRHGTGYDLAGAIVWLSSRDGSYVTGQTINVNGGVVFN